MYQCKRSVVAWRAGLLLTAGLVCACAGPPGPVDEKSPVEVPPDIRDEIAPDFRISSLTVRGDPGARSWEVWVNVENAGGSRLSGGAEAPGTIPPLSEPELRLIFDVLECPGVRDTGEADFVCERARVRRFQRTLLLSRNLESVGLHGWFTLHSPWQIHVLAEPTWDDVPILESDYPVRANNRALLRIVYDPERSSFHPPDTWHWPNDEDSLPY